MERALIFVDCRGLATVIEWTRGGELDRFIEEVGPVCMEDLGLDEQTEGIQRTGLYAWEGEVQEREDQDSMGPGEKMVGDLSMATEGFTIELGLGGSRDGCLMVGSIISGR